MKKYLLLGITVVAASLALPVVAVATVDLMPISSVYFSRYQRTEWGTWEEGKNSVAHNSEITYSFPSVSSKKVWAGSYKVNNQTFAHNLIGTSLSNHLNRIKATLPGHHHFLFKILLRGYAKKCGMKIQLALYLRQSISLVQFFQYAIAREETRHLPILPGFR